MQETCNMEKYTLDPKASNAYKGIAMEGVIATWYAKTARGDEEFRFSTSRQSSRQVSRVDRLP
jgi:hypothetical protein